MIWLLAEEIDYLILFKVKYMAVQGCEFLQTVLKNILVVEFGHILLNYFLSFFSKK